MILDRISKRFQFRFKNRTIAAIALSEMLKDSIKKHEKEDFLVLGIPRAGALTADIVSKRLSIPNFDLIVSRKLTDPDNKEQAIGAVMHDGSKYLLDNLINKFQIPDDYLDGELITQLNEIKRRRDTYYQNRDSISSPINEVTKYPNILIIDDGIATGSTMTVAIEWLRRQYEIKDGHLDRIIIAAPVAPKNITEVLKRKYKAEVEVVFHPSESVFYSVQQYHQNFEPITDEQVVKILEERVNIR